MKPFYGIDRTTLKKNTFHEGDCFIAATVSDMTRQSYERALQSAAKELEATKLNPVLRGLKTVCSWITLFGFLSTIRALRNVTIAEAFENAPFIFWLMGGCGIVWLVLTILTNRKAKPVMAGEDCNMSTRRLEGEIDRVFRELQVPEDAKEDDVCTVEDFATALIRYVLILGSISVVSYMSLRYFWNVGSVRPWNRIIKYI